MKANTLIRKIHRWTSVVFTLTVIANFIAMAMLGRDDPRGMYVGFAAIPPLLILLPTGLYLFVLPYFSKVSFEETK